MALRAMALDGGRMPASTPRHLSGGRLAPTPPALDPARELYDRASDALHASHQLAVASGTPGSAAAVAPALACSEASLDALACAVDAMCREVERVAGPPRAVASTRFGDRAVVVDERFARASDALRAARCAIGALREAVGPVPSRR